MKRTYQNAHKWMLAMVLVCTLLTGLIIPAQAYSAWNYHMKGSWQYEYYYVDGREDGYGERSDDAVKAWNDAVDARTNWTSLKPSLDIRLSETNDGSARTTRVVISPLDRGPDGYAGFTYYYDVDGRGTWSVINYGGYPNQNYQSGSAVINRHYTDNYSNVRQQNVIMHEMGHIFGLMHSENSSALMWESIAGKTTLVKPQSDDVAGVRSIYE